MSDAPWLIREATSDDIDFIRTYLPAALHGTPPALVIVATEGRQPVIAGAVALRVFSDRVARFGLVVGPDFRRRGCGRVLLEALRERAHQQGVIRLLSDAAYPVPSQDESIQVALEFSHRCGLTVQQEISTFRTQTSVVLSVLEPLLARFAASSTLRFVPITQVDAGQLSTLVINHVGGLREDIMGRLTGSHEQAYSRTLSLAAITDTEIAGVLLTRRLNDDTVVVDTRIVAAGHRGGWINVALMCLAARQALQEGISLVQFDSDVLGQDTNKLARRFKAEVVGRIQCLGETLDPSVRLPLPDRVRCEPIPPSTPPSLGVLTSQHTSSFAELLEHYGISLAVTTYQAGKLVLLRAKDGVINTHFRGFHKPMGLAFDGNRLAIGTAVEIWEFHNAPAIASRMASADSTAHDACFMPRGSHTTGDVQMHEMAWVKDPIGDSCSRGEGQLDLAESSLWFINTRFSCLCTRDVRYSFVPRWRPPFVSAIAPEDRCHLNGFCVDQSRVTPSFFVTALGETDSVGGWRANKRNGGLLMRTSNNEVLVRGLSMPHSPRWYADQLWVCESGTGTFGRVDLSSGRYEPIATLPGFTRGVDFVDRFAFIGLSQVRESAIFSGIPIADRPVSERCCGVWVIDLVTGETVAWLKFDDGVQEIFAVTVLTNTRYPDVINDNPKLIADSFVLPDEPLAAVPDKLRWLSERRPG